MQEKTKSWLEWLKNSRFSYMSDEQVEQTFRWLFQVRDHVLNRACLKTGDTLLDVGTGRGLLAFGAYERMNGSGKVIASDMFSECIEDCKNAAIACNIEDMEFLVSSADSIDLPDNSVDVVVMRSVLVHILNKHTAVKEFLRVLKPGGRVSIFEPVINSNTRYYELINPENITNYEKIRDAETKIMTNENDALTNFSADSLKEKFVNAGFKDVNLFLGEEKSTYTANADMIDPWFNTPAGGNNKTMRERFLEYLTEEEVNVFINELKTDLNGKEITLCSFSAYISGTR